MDFRFTPEQERFREEVREFLRQELPADWQGGGSYGDEGGESTRELGRRMMAKLAERKWLAMAWPKEYGGLGASHMQQLVYNEEMSYQGAPGGFSMGVAWVGPSIMLYGTDEQKQRYLPRITGGEDVWCTLYSEPEAGSDLASLQPTAVQDGDDLVITGQKIWTSTAQRSQWGWPAARPHPHAPTHKAMRNVRDRAIHVADHRNPREYSLAEADEAASDQVAGKDTGQDKNGHREDETDPGLILQLLEKREEFHARAQLVERTVGTPDHVLQTEPHVREQPPCEPDGNDEAYVTYAREAYFF